MQGTEKIICKYIRRHKEKSRFSSRKNYIGFLSSVSAYWKSGQNLYRPSLIYKPRTCNII